MSLSHLGLGLVLMALLTCAAGAPIGFMAGANRSAAGLQWTKRLAYAFALFMLLANLVMEYALVTRDFSVSYVASVGSHATPLHITIVSLWSSLEGSILFWGLVLGGFTAAVTYLQRRGHDDSLAYTLATYTEHWTPKAGGETTSSSGRWAIMWKRQEDGSWKIAAEIWNLAPEED